MDRKEKQHLAIASYSIRAVRAFLFFCPVVTALFTLQASPPQWGWESESGRFGVWSRWRRGSPLGPGCFSQPRQHALLSGRTPVCWRQTRAYIFIHVWALTNFQKSLWATNYSSSGRYLDLSLFAYSLLYNNHKGLKRACDPVWFLQRSLARGH